MVGAFPDGQSALNLAAARLRHIAGTAWSTKRYLNIELLNDQQMRGAHHGLSQSRRRQPKSKCEKILTLPVNFADQGFWNYLRGRYQADYIVGTFLTQVGSRASQFTVMQKAAADL